MGYFIVFALKVYYTTYSDRKCRIQTCTGSCFQFPFRNFDIPANDLFNYTKKIVPGRNLLCEIRCKHAMVMFMFWCNQLDNT